MNIDPELEPLFPDALLGPTLAQATCWTSVSSIVTAAKVIEARTDKRTSHFYLAFPDDELLQAVLVRVLGYASREYRCSPQKLALAKRVDPRIQRQTLETLAHARVNPTISVGGPSFALKAMPPLRDRGPVRVLKVVDDPPMLELLFEPFQMLRTIVVSQYTEAAAVRTVEREARERTGGDAGSSIVHRPYGDGALAATLDAMVYFALGFHVGIEWGTDRVSIEPGFRCVNVVGQPPFQPVLFELARSAFQALMRELARP